MARQTARIESLERPRALPGELIRIGPYEGVVLEVRAGGLVLEGASGSLVTLPAAWCDMHPLELLSPIADPRPLPLFVRVARQADVALASDALLRAARETAGVLHEPAPIIELVDAADEALTFLLGVHVPRAVHPLRLRSAVLIRALDRLREAGIDAPRSTQDVYFRDLDFVRATVHRVLAGGVPPRSAVDQPAEGDDVLAGGNDADAAG